MKGWEGRGEGMPTINRTRLLRRKRKYEGGKRNEEEEQENRDERGLSTLIKCPEERERGGLGGEGRRRPSEPGTLNALNPTPPKIKLCSTEAAFGTNFWIKKKCPQFLGMQGAPEPII